MASLSDVDFETVRERITPARARSFQTIHVAVVFSVMVLIALNFFLFGLGSESPPNDGDVDEMNTLVIVLAADALLCLVAGRFVLRAQFSRERLEAAAEGSTGDPVELADRAINHLYRARIIRLALFEGVSLFGLVIVLIGIRNGTLYHHLEYLVALVPACAFLVMLAATFPTLDGLAAEVRRRIIDRPA